MSCQEKEETFPAAATQATETKENEPPVSQKPLPSYGKVGGLRAGEIEARALKEHEVAAGSSLKLVTSLLQDFNVSF